MNELEDRIRTWCREEGMLIADRHPEDDGWACSVTGMESDEIEIGVIQRAERPDRVVLHHVFTPAGAAVLPEETDALSSYVSGVAVGRSSLIDCEVGDELPPTVHVRATLYIDGANKHSFMTLLAEVGKTRQVIEGGLNLINAIDEQSQADLEALSVIVDAEEQVVLEPARQVPSECPECRSPVAAGGRFCTRCGRQMEGN
jgi:hypothetical protein